MKKILYIAVCFLLMSITAKADFFPDGTSSATYIDNGTGLDVTVNMGWGSTTTEYGDGFVVTIDGVDYYVEGTTTGAWGDPGSPLGVTAPSGFGDFAASPTTVTITIPYPAGWVSGDMVMVMIDGYGDTFGDDPSGINSSYLDETVQAVGIVCDAAISDPVPFATAPCPGEDFTLVLDGSVATNYGPAFPGAVTGPAVGWAVLDAPGGAVLGYAVEDVQGSADGLFTLTHPGTGVDPFGVGITVMCFVPTTLVDNDDVNNTITLDPDGCIASGAEICVDFSNTFATATATALCTAGGDAFDVSLTGVAGGVAPLTITDDAGGPGGAGDYTVPNVPGGAAVTFTILDGEGCTTTIVANTPAIPTFDPIDALCSDGSDGPAAITVNGLGAEGILQIDVLFDGCTTESNWEILDAGGLQVAAEGTPGDGVGPNGADPTLGVVVSYQYTLPAGTYTVNYLDDFGDGMQDFTCGSYCVASTQDGTMTLTDVASGTTNAPYSPVGDGTCGTGVPTTEAVGTITVTPFIGTLTGAGVTDNGDGTGSLDATGLPLGTTTVTYSDPATGCDVMLDVVVEDCNVPAVCGGAIDYANGEACNLDDGTGITLVTSEQLSCSINPEVDNGDGTLTTYSFDIYQTDDAGAILGFLGSLFESPFLGSTGCIGNLPISLPLNTTCDVQIYYFQVVTGINTIDITDPAVPFLASFMDDPLCTPDEFSLTVHPVLTATDVTADAATCGTLQVDLLAEDGVVCDSQTQACAADGDVLNADFSATINDPLGCSTLTAASAACSGCFVPMADAEITDPCNCALGIDLDGDGTNDLASETITITDAAGMGQGWMITNAATSGLVDPDGMGGSVATTATVVDNGDGTYTFTAYVPTDGSTYSADFANAAGTLSLNQAGGPCPACIDVSDVPTVGEWGLIMLGLLMSITAIVGIRQRREEEVTA